MHVMFLTKKVGRNVAERNVVGEKYYQVKMSFSRLAYYSNVPFDSLKDRPLASRHHGEILCT